MSAYNLSILDFKCKNGLIYSAEYQLIIYPYWILNQE